jgi:hypothetical protein
MAMVTILYMAETIPGRKERKMKANDKIGVFTFLMLLAFCGQAFGATFYVDDDAAGPGTGTRANPFPTIQAGIDRADYGDEVLVLAGTYHERIELKNGVQLIGGSGPPTIDGGGHGSVVTAIGVDNRTIFDGFRVINGDASEGGGMYVEDSTLRIRYCTFEENFGWTGGGIFLTGSSPRITACRFENNRSVNGGGINMQFDSNPTIERCEFVDNNANQDIGVGKGGGMSIGPGCRPRVKDCEFQDNYADPYGGGIAMFEATPMIEDCIFHANRTSYWGFGGAIWAEETDTQAFFYNSTFFENQALVGGGVYSADGAEVLLINCTLYGNRATGSSSAEGGALFCGDGSTIGAYNSIIWSNSSPQISGDRGSSFFIHYCDVQGGYAGVGNIDTEPSFVNAAGGNFHLRSDSPCIDTGFDLMLMPELDIDGDDRIIDGDRDGSAVPDIGIDEYNPDRTFRFIIPITRLIGFLGSNQGGSK